MGYGSNVLFSRIQILTVASTNFLLSQIHARETKLYVETVWYRDGLRIEIRQNWFQLKSAFVCGYQITTRGLRVKRFELRMKVAQLKQEDRENMIEYLKRSGKTS